MTTQELVTEIETLKTAIGMNMLFLGLVPPGADKKTERQVELDRRELARLREQLEAL